MQKPGKAELKFPCQRSFEKAKFPRIGVEKAII